MSIIMIYMLLFLLAVAVRAQSPYYDLPAYYGHFSHNFFSPVALKNAKMVELEYHFAADANYDSTTLYFAQEAEHCIYAYYNSTRKVEQFAGNCGTAGNIVGSV